MSTIETLKSSDVNYSVATPDPLVVSTSFVGAYMPDFVPVSAAGGARTITLPLIGSTFAPVGKRVTIRKTDLSANIVTITPSGGDGIATVLGANTTLLQGGTAGFVTLQANIGNWDIVYSSTSGVAGFVQAGTGTLLNGAATIAPATPFTTSSSIVVTRRGAFAPATSVMLRVTAPVIGAGGATATVNSIDAANTIVVADQSTFSWISVG